MKRVSKYGMEVRRDIKKKFLFYYFYYFQLEQFFSGTRPLALPYDEHNLSCFNFQYIPRNLTLFLKNLFYRNKLKFFFTNYYKITINSHYLFLNNTSKDYLYTPRYESWKKKKINRIRPRLPSRTRFLLGKPYYSRRKRSLLYIRKKAFKKIRQWFIQTNKPNLRISFLKNKWDNISNIIHSWNHIIYPKDLISSFSFNFVIEQIFSKVQNHLQNKFDFDQKKKNMFVFS